MRILITMFLVLAMGTSHCQYTWFNNLYDYSPNSSAGASFITAKPDTLLSVGYGLFYDENNVFQTGLLTKKINPSNGQEYFQQHAQFATITYGSPVGCRIEQPDQSWLMMFHYDSDLECRSPVVMHIDSNLNLIEEIVVPPFGDCALIGGDFHNPDGLFTLDNGNLMVTTRVDFDIPGLDSTGHYFQEVGYNGEIINTHYVGDGDSEALVSYSFEKIHKLTNNKLIIQGNAGINSTAAGPFIQRTNIQGDPEQEVLLASGPYGWAENSGAALMEEEENQMIYFHAVPTFYDMNLGHGYFDLKCARIGIEPLQISQDVTIEIPEITDTTKFAGIGITKILKGQDGGYIISLILEFQNAYTLIVKLDDSLSLDWYRFFYPPGWNQSTFAYSADMTKTFDGGYALGGDVSIDGQPQWLIKTDACGYDAPSSCPPLVGISENNQPTIQFWPNPVQQILKANLPVDTKSIAIVDASGRVVHSENIYYPHQEWDIRYLSNGIYFLEVAMESGVKRAVRFVKE
jgi:Secretion system C-terminal sorting domain